MTWELMVEDQTRRCHSTFVYRATLSWNVQVEGPQAKNAKRSISILR
jgi:hypothetical protein